MSCGYWEGGWSLGKNSLEDFKTSEAGLNISSAIMCVECKTNLIETYLKLPDLNGP